MTLPKLDCQVSHLSTYCTHITYEEVMVHWTNTASKDRPCFISLKLLAQAA